MKKIILFLAVLISGFSSLAQIDESVRISGKINVSLEDDVSGINIFNISNGQYTFTDDYGRYKITVKEGDELVFSSVQYQQFSVIITKSVIEKKELNVNLSTKTNVLDEIVVKPSLSGEASVDVMKLKTVKPNIPGLDANEIIYGYDYEFTSDRFTSPENDAIDKGYLKNGINFANIFKSIFGIKSKVKDNTQEYMDIEIRKLYTDEFFREYLDVEEEKINDFVFFMEERGMNLEKIRRFNDLQLIEYILDESKEFNKQKED